VDVWDERCLASVAFDLFTPKISDDEREVKFERWQLEVERSLNGQAKETAKASRSLRTSRMLASVPATIFAFSTALLCKMAACLTPAVEQLAAEVAHVEVPQIVASAVSSDEVAVVAAGVVTALTD